MASGPEMLVNAMMKAMGINPAEFIANINGFVGFVRGQMEHFNMSANTINERLSKIEAQQAEILALLVKEKANGHDIDGDSYQLGLSRSGFGGDRRQLRWDDIGSVNTISAGNDPSE